MILMLNLILLIVLAGLIHELGHALGRDDIAIDLAVDLEGRDAAQDVAPVVEIQFLVIIEIPRGSRNKYEMDHHTGQVRLDRVLYS